MWSKAAGECTTTTGACRYYARILELLAFRPLMLKLFVIADAGCESIL